VVSGEGVRRQDSGKGVRRVGSEECGDSGEGVRRVTVVRV